MTEPGSHAPREVQTTWGERQLLPARSDRTQAYPKLARVFQAYLEKNGLSVTGFHGRLVAKADDLGLRRVPGRAALDGLRRGKPSFRTTAEAVEHYLREYAADLTTSDGPMVPVDGPLLPLSDFHLAAFAGVSERKMRRVGPGLRGRFIAYALCESMQDHVRVGEIIIEYNPAKPAIWMFERQARPLIEHDGQPIFAAREQRWEGEIAPRKERYGGLLRVIGSGAAEFDFKFVQLEVLNQCSGSERVGEIGMSSYNTLPETGHHRPERYWLVRQDAKPITCSVKPVQEFPRTLISRIAWPNDPLLSEAMRHAMGVACCTTAAPHPAGKSPTQGEM